MHMADALLSPAVGGVMCAVSAGALAYSAAKVKKDDLCERKIPVMAVSGAFVFAAQMINFTIPGTGSSGHIGGGILLAGMLGGTPAVLVLAAVLIIQCLFFADGGLLALGCNIFNMGVIPCLFIWPLIFRPLLRKNCTRSRIMLACVLSVVVGLQLGAFAVVLETVASGVTVLPFKAFVLLMQPIHLAIGAVEGLVTGAVLCFVYQMRPEILQSALSGSGVGSGVSMKKLLIILAAAALLVGGGLSWFASSNPDGLEWSIAKVAGSVELESEGAVHESAAKAQQSTALMPDYDYESGDGSGTAAAGIIGGVLTFALAGGTGLLISHHKKKKKAAN